MIHNFNEWLHHLPSSLSEKFTCRCPIIISHNPVKSLIPADLTLKMFLKLIWPSPTLSPLPWSGPHHLPHKPQHQLPNCSSYFNFYPFTSLLHTAYITPSPCRDRSMPCIPCWLKSKTLNVAFKVSLFLALPISSVSFPATQSGLSRKHLTFYAHAVYFMPLDFARTALSVWNNTTHPFLPG